MQIYESVLNVRLADELKSRGLTAAEEAQQPGNRRIDVAVRIGTATVAVEAEHGQSTRKKREAIHDADARLEQGLAQCAVAVCYPDGTTKDSLKSTKNLTWTVRGDSDAEREAVWQYGDLDQLASVIRLTPAQLGDPDAVAASLSISLDVAVNRLNDVQKQRLAAKLDLPHDKKVKSQRWDKAAKRALLVVATAVMFHSRLDGHLAEMKPELEPTLPPPQHFQLAATASGAVPREN